MKDEKKRAKYISYWIQVAIHYATKKERFDFFYTPVIPKWEEIKPLLKAETRLYCEEPNVLFGKVLWNVWVCNCGNPDITDPSFDNPVQKPCDSKDCRKFTITWSDDCSEKEKYDVSFSLYYAFKCASSPGYGKLSFQPSNKNDPQNSTNGDMAIIEEKEFRHFWRTEYLKKSGEWKNPVWRDFCLRKWNLDLNRFYGNSSEASDEASSGVL
eukprot:GHVP01025927.1.p1 GENE.GHVP01025927.1~~GHVP01025927.1.p1  ORF type:complete len:212 (+),score=27.38 GHVP01025927.1:269-904(+)